MGDEGASHHFRDDPRRGDNSRDDSVEYLGTIRKWHMRVLLHLLDRILLTILGEKFQPLVPSLELGSSSSSSKAKSDPRLPPKLRSDGGSKCSTLAAKGVVISEKCPRDEVPDILPIKKVKSTVNSKGKGTTSPHKAKKKFKLTPSKTASKGPRLVVVVGEGTSAIPSDVLGLTASMLDNPTMVEKLLERVIPPFDREKVGKLNLDQAISRLFHGVGQAIEKLRKMKEDQDATVERLKKEIAELQKKEVLVKKSAIQEYKSSDDFQEEVELAASKYFVEGFYLSKKQVGASIPSLTFKIWAKLSSIKLLYRQSDLPQDQSSEESFIFNFVVDGFKSDAYSILYLLARWSLENKFYTTAVLVGWPIYEQFPPGEVIFLVLFFRDPR
ncbi:hypothetical protein Acr_06g0010010 [Actinidia rufa]|uniref:Uncharacterized protein n=1 Tax=Actinidia rufa TaxID=165716 RepID=A0A7J0ERF5_9ERIC|nr:hypothetical protein Acr_06g0010010 [Actinidia rufa]